MTEQVDVHELHDDLSTYLDRARNGETIEVTEDGRPLALLAPPLRSGATSPNSSALL